MEKLEKAMNFINQGKLEKAKEVFEEMVSDNPTNVDALYNLGMCFTDLDQPETAIEILEKCIKYKPDYSNAYVALGFAYSKMGDFDNAKKNFVEGLKLDPKNSYALRNLGGLFGGMDDYEKSLYYLTKAYEINPADPNTVYGLGYTYDLLGDFEKADKYYKEVLKLEAPEHIIKLTKDRLREIAVSQFKSEGPRMDAVFYLLGALQRFEQKTDQEIKDITFEIALKGQTGLDINNPNKTYTLNSIEGEFTGLQLVCYMYAGFKRIEPSLDVGIDLSDEYSLAVQLYDSGDII